MDNTKRIISALILVIFIVCKLNPGKCQRVPVNGTVDAERNVTTDRIEEYNYTTISSATKDITATEAYNFERWRCFDGPKPQYRYKAECCATEYERYLTFWFNGGYYLTTLLERLQRWDCREFRLECANPTFPYSEFTELVYDRYCKPTTLQEKCTEKVKSVVERYDFIKRRRHEDHIKENRWGVLIDSLQPQSMYEDDLTQPCVQIALFDRTSGGVGRFHEIVEPYIPFCTIIWTGYDIDTAMDRNTSPWTSMSIRCRAGIIIGMIVMVIGAVVTIVGNITVLGVFFMTPKLRNSQAVYKISLAMADLLVGMIVWPNMIVMQDWMFMAPRAMGRVVSSPNPNDTRWVAYYFAIKNDSLEYRRPGGGFGTIIQSPYINFLGFFVTFSLVISVYTLMVASFDRFWAVFRPLRYNKHDAKRHAKIASGILWGFSFILSILPIFVEPIKYGAMSSIFVSSDGPLALALLLVGFIIPIVVVWVITVATFQTSKRHAKNRQRIVSTNAKSNDSLERRLAKTLALMVGVFTISVLPGMLCICAGFFLTYADWSKPQTLDVYSAMIYTSCEYVSIIFLTTNSFWNCIIYSVRTNGFRDAAKVIYANALENSCFKCIGRGAQFIFSSARRVSLTSIYTMRKMSSSSNSDLRKKSVTSLATGTTRVSESLGSGRPSMDITGTSIDLTSGSNDSTLYSATYTKHGAKGNRIISSGVEQRAERKKGQKEEEYAGEDSTFGSFAVDAGADRFFVSVMEDVEELDEDESHNGNQNGKQK